jgi:hypothetical protein
MLTEPAPRRIGVWERLRPRNIWRRYVLYNRWGMAVLYAANRLRWRYADIPLILWPPAREEFDAIEKDIRDRHQVLTRQDYLVDEAQFSAFVQRVYAVDSASPGKIEIKLGNLVCTPLVIRVLTVRFKWPRMEVQDILNTVRCKDAHWLKDSIRKTYRDRVRDYIFDIIVHSSETAAQGVTVLELVREYGKPVSEDLS